MTAAQWAAMTPEQQAAYWAQWQQWEAYYKAQVRTEIARTCTCADGCIRRTQYIEAGDSRMLVFAHSAAAAPVMACRRQFVR